jgi:hypothetical protein
MFNTLSIALGVFLVYKIVVSTYRNKKFRLFKKKKGCQDAIDLSGSFPYGFERINRIRNLRKSGEDVLDDILGAEFKTANTFEMTMMEGSRLLTTIEPANVQAMLATQFSDYETGKMRHNQFWPVLGRSIFSSDGAFWEHSRALLRPQFVRENINDLDETDRAASLLIQAMGRLDANNWITHVDLLPLIYNFTLGNLLRLARILYIIKY